jgi:Uma2 family endonuclease
MWPTARTADTTTKRAIYARHAVAELWILDNQGRKLDAYRALADERYEEEVSYEPGAAIAPVAFPGLQIPWWDAL